ncbi:twin transmembrane helix small protein [Methyloraptor flagellatus]|jgi:hypothetical protein|uniref:Twin transmembrane helix small protein n=1 Tax=Methyloraptor flagellatus TaxID=3162530 RepID=A0AAU7XBC8_9HYPH
MAGFFYHLVPFAIGAVIIVLAMGLFNLLRGGSANTSQTLMRWRIGLQAIALVIIMIAIALMDR